MWSVPDVKHVSGTDPYAMVGRARFELATNGLRSKLALLNELRGRNPHNLAINRSYKKDVSERVSTQ